MCNEHNRCVFVQLVQLHHCFNGTCKHCGYRLYPEGSMVGTLCILLPNIMISTTGLKFKLIGSKRAGRAERGSEIIVGSKQPNKK